MKKSEKVVSMICIIAAIVTIIIFMIFKDKKTSDKYDAYFVLDNQTNYGYTRKNEFSIINDEIITSSDLLFDTYDNGKYIGNNHLSKVNSWNIFDKKENYITYSEYLFAYHGKYKFSIDQTNYRNINEKEKELLKNNFEISNFDYLFTNEVYDIDLNNDGDIDKIICLSNNSMEIAKSNRYNLIVTIINDKVKAFVEEYNVESTDVYKLKAFFNFNNSKYKYIVVEKIMNYDGDIDSYSISDNIYHYDGKNYKQVKATKK